MMYEDDHVIGLISAMLRSGARASPSRLANFRRLIEKCRFARDSPLEGSGFEPLVPSPCAPETPSWH
jgi:hypothetical protein